MRLMSIASGSSGNSSYIGSENTSILLDVGISAKKITEGINSLDINPKEIDAILITHEHIDHIRGLGVLLRKYNIPVYATYGTIDGILECGALGTFDYNLLKPVNNTDSFMIGDIRVDMCPISHDANDPVCYSFRSGGKKISVATDLGVYDDMIVDFISESDAMIVEANHDIRMLEAGPYPYPLKQRILSDKGHLCNEASGRLIREVLNDHLKFISLGHLSDKNNYADLAFATVKHELSDNSFFSDVREVGLCVAPRYDCGKIVEI